MKPIVKMKGTKIHISFKNAFEGIFYFICNERNGQIEIALGVLAVIGGIALQISKCDWLAVLLCIGAVVSAEMMNSAIEKFCDHVHPSLHHNIKIVKDMAAGGVLIISIISALIGTLVFIPKIYHLIWR